uniref:ZP domain-containing protein n=1 Tax=Panagrolaimus davidi TaxID=227884 RepID=A0A914PYC3_9BILA
MKLKLYILLKLGFLIGFSYQIGVSVSCSLKNMDLMFTFDDPFYGKIMMRPNQSCTAKGRGHARLKLTISLDEETRNRCSIVKHGSEYIGAVDIQMHENLRMQEDISYLIRCPINNPNEIEVIRTSNVKEKGKESLAKLKIFDKKKNISTKTATVGKQYDMHLVVPYQKEIAENVKVGQCIAFTGEEELKLVQLTDNV